jgi:predicted dienelactone hydrolase
MSLSIFALIATLVSCSDPSSVETTTSSTTGTGFSTTTPVAEAGCEDATFLSRPADLAARGPWPVGARTVTVAGLHTEVFYPAPMGSESGLEMKQYDPRGALPKSEAALVSDAVNTYQDCDCYDDLPIDSAYGPYPIIIFVHGTASWETQSLTQMVHWASRGFVVVSARHPGLFLGDTLALICPFDATGVQDLGGDISAMLNEIRKPTADLAFLSGYIDADRMALTGHSAGGYAVTEEHDLEGVQVVIPMASSGAVSDSGNTASLFLGGQSDAVVPYTDTQDAYTQSAGQKWLLGITNAGHLAFSDICELTNDAGENLVTVAQNAGVCGTEFAALLFDCNPSYVDPAIANDIINASSSGVLESVLQCADIGQSLDDLPTNYSDIGEYDHSE